ncbi:MAG: hypothetical protein ACR2G2_11155 [Pseudonocardia sp.]
MSSPPYDPPRSPSLAPGWSVEPAPPPGLTLPPIDRLPDRPASARHYRRQPVDQNQPDVLRQFVDHGTSSWSAERVPLSVAVTGTLWTLLIVNIALGAWLFAVLSGAASCSGWPCSIATLGGHAGLLLGLSGSCLAALAGSALVTRGLTGAGAVPLAMVIFGAVCGSIALVGVVALVGLTVAAVALAATVFVVLVDHL